MKGSRTRPELFKRVSDQKKIINFSTTPKILIYNLFCSTRCPKMTNCNGHCKHWCIMIKCYLWHRIMTDWSQFHRQSDSHMYNQEICIYQISWKTCQLILSTKRIEIYQSQLFHLLAITKQGISKGCTICRIYKT